MHYLWAFICGATGLMLLLVPTNSLLQWDRRTVYRLYVRLGSSDRALVVARWTYKVFGIVMLFLSLAFEAR